MWSWEAVWYLCNNGQVSTMAMSFGPWAAMRFWEDQILEEAWSNIAASTIRGLQLSFLCIQIVIEFWIPDGPDGHQSLFQHVYAQFADRFSGIAFYRVNIRDLPVSNQTSLSSLSASDSIDCRCMLVIFMKKAVFDSNFVNIAKTTMHWKTALIHHVYTLAIYWCLQIRSFTKAVFHEMQWS